MRAKIKAEDAGQPLGLTVSEADVVRAYIEHMSQKRIAQALGLSVNTVNTYLERARQRTGLQNNVMLAVAFDRAERALKRYKPTQGKRFSEPAWPVLRRENSIFGMAGA